MASYTIEDIELIRRKSGISYQEAVALLDYHNGNVARALVDLERNGRIRPETAQTAEKPRYDKARKHNSRQNGFSGFLNRLYQFRLKVKKENVTILNVSLIFTILAVIISPHLALIGALVMLALGYRVSFDRRDADFAADNLERMVRNAGENVKETVSDFARGFGEAFSDNEPRVKEEPVVPKAAEEPAPAPERSYYASNPAAATYHHTYNPDSPVPTIQVPVQVESQDGSVQLDSDKDGYHSATIE